MQDYERRRELWYFNLVSTTEDANPKSVRHTVEIEDRSRITSYVTLSAAQCIICKGVLV